MIFLGLALIASAGSIPTVSSAEIIKQARHAIESSRRDQARLMIGRAVEAGATPTDIGHLLADLAFADQDFASAVPLYDALLAAGVADAQVTEKAGVAKLHTGDIAGAATLLDRATSAQGASWRAWNARGVIADFRQEWDAADTAYQRALALAPDRAEIINNLGWSLLLQGRWADGEAMLARAVSLDSSLNRATNNLELARTALSEGLPERAKGESEEDWAARLNDAGVVAKLQGDDRKAVAAFTRALEARSDWFDRAANNLVVTERAN
jgi:Flp pilus assembly protein TadD